MKKIVFFVVLMSLAGSLGGIKNVFADLSTTAAVLQQTVIQTAEHARQLAETIQTIELLQSQVQNTQEMLQLAIKASEGIDGTGFVSDFHNVILETKNAIDDLKTYVDTDTDVSGQWKNVFGSLDQWVKNSSEAFGNIDMSDKVNSTGYLIADSYQKLYQQNSNYVNQFVENSKNVSEKGALRQIAQEVAQLIQMENNVVYLLSELLKGQSIEHSNDNLNRKADIIKFEQENDGIRRFMSLAANDSLQMQ